MGKFGIGARVIDGDGDTGTVVGKRKGEREVFYEQGLVSVRIWQPKADLTPVGLRLELGKTYVDRDGVEHGPLEVNEFGFADTHPFCAGDRSWREDGGFLHSNDTDNWDLVAEVVEPSICEEKCEVAYSVGDRVIVTDTDTRGGKKVGPMKVTEDGWTDFLGMKSAFDNQATDEQYTADGYYLSGQRDSADDIVGLWVEPVAEVAPVEPALTIEVGKFYTTRDGRKVGPMEHSGLRFPSEWPFTVEHPFIGGAFGKAWRRNGAFDPYGHESPADLVAEWIDLPVAEPALSPVKYEPKFKKGDRLECVDASDTEAVALGEVYVAERDCYDGNAFVEIEGVGGMLSRRFRLAPPTWTPKVGDKVRWTEKFKASMYTKGKVYEIGRESGKYLCITDDAEHTDPATTSHLWPTDDIIKNFELVAPWTKYAPPAPKLPPLGAIVTITGKLTGAQNNGGNVSVTFDTSTGGRSFDVPASAIRAA